jgi:Uma2 family endonuclease
LWYTYTQEHNYTQGIITHDTIVLDHTIILDVAQRQHHMSRLALKFTHIMRVSVDKNQDNREITDMAESVQPIRVHMTYADYCTLPSDGKRYEVLEGELVMYPAPSLNHQRVSRKLESILLDHIENNNLGEIFYAPVDVILSETNVAQPDLVFVSREKSSILAEKGISGSPDLMVEILSPGTSRLDRIAKFQMYCTHGVPWYWIVDPDSRSLEEYHLQGGGYVSGASVSGFETFHPGIFPGLEISLSSLWPS